MDAGPGIGTEWPTNIKIEVVYNNGKINDEKNDGHGEQLEEAAGAEARTGRRKGTGKICAVATESINHQDWTLVNFRICHYEDMRSGMKEMLYVPAK